MIPYIDFRRITIGPVSFGTTSILVALAIITGHLLFVRRARRQGFDPQLAAALSAVMLLGGIVLGHWIKLLYSPNAWQRIQQFPWILLLFFSGQASFGGLGGGLLAAGLFLRWKNIGFAASLRLLDCLAVVFPYAWFFGRLHCVVAHDHPGIRTSGWLGVRYPDATRFDLAVLEILFLPVPLVLFYLLKGRGNKPGIYLATFLVTYGVFRMALDQLHVEVIRYLGLSVDQWASTLAILSGLLILKGGTTGAARSAARS